MKRLFTLFLLPLLLFSSCGEKPTVLINDAFKIDFKNSEINKNSNGDYLIDIYGISDFHGALEYFEGEEIGIARLGSMYSLYRLNNPGGAIFLSSGDMWQGSADSNITRGSLVNEIMNHMGFEAMALGNHEFDWTIDIINTNKEKANFPYLANNIIDTTTGDNVDFVLPHYLIDRGEVQIGVIGSIGEGITTEILQSSVENLEFDNPDKYVIESSNILKEQGADLIVYLTHDDVYTVSDTITPYIDVAFCGHSHLKQYIVKDNVPILQTKNNGANISHVQFAINDNKKELVVAENIDADLNILPHKDIDDIYKETYEKEIKQVKEEVVGEVHCDVSDFDVGRVLTKYLYDKYNTNNDILFACHNEARSGFKAGPVTYGDVYKALPFDNLIELLEIKGYALAKYMNHITYPDSFDIKYEPNETYKIISMQYLSEKYESYISHEFIGPFAREELKSCFIEDSDHNPFN